MFHNDSIQVYFDLLNNHEDGVGETVQDDMFYTLGLDKNRIAVAYMDKNPSGRYIGDANLTKGIDHDVKLAFKKTQKGYLWEVLIPQTTMPYAKLTNGSIFAFSIIINDNDGKGRKQGLTMTPKGTEPYGRMKHWQAVQLVSTGK